MKILFFGSFLIFVIASSVTADEATKPFQIAKAVKLGRGSTSYLSGTSRFQNGSESGLRFECDARCATCDENSGTCSLCSANYYISGKNCLPCPDKHFCDGVKAVSNCDGVQCRSGTTPTPSDTGCCCN